MKPTCPKHLGSSLRDPFPSREAVQRLIDLYRDKYDTEITYHDAFPILLGLMRILYANHIHQQRLTHPEFFTDDEPRYIGMVTAAQRKRLIAEGKIDEDGRILGPGVITRDYITGTE